MSEEIKVPELEVVARNFKTRDGYDVWDKLCAIPKYGFLIGPGGGVVKVLDIGNWIDRDEAQSVVDVAQTELNETRSEALAGYAVRDARIEELQHRCGMYGLELTNEVERRIQATEKAKELRAELASAQDQLRDVTVDRYEEQAELSALREQGPAISANAQIVNGMADALRHVVNELDGESCEDIDYSQVSGALELFDKFYTFPVVSAEQQGVPSIEASYAIGAKGGSVVDAERLAFESWMAGHCWALCAAWDGSAYKCESEDGGHFNAAAGMTRRIWAAWIDRAALAAAPAPSTPEGKV